jgi:uncharacterized membrane protein
MNVIFFVWIGDSFAATYSSLIKHNQTIKAGIIRKVMISMYSGFALTCIVILTLYFLIVLVDKDVYWRYEWIIQTMYFNIFTFLLFWIMAIVRPTYRSKMLATLEELKDERTSETDPHSMSIEMTHSERA